MPLPSGRSQLTGIKSTYSMLCSPHQRKIFFEAKTGVLQWMAINTSGGAVV